MDRAPGSHGVSDGSRQAPGSCARRGSRPVPDLIVRRRIVPGPAGDDG